MSDHVGDAHDLRVGGWLEVPGQRQPPDPTDAETVVFPAIRHDARPPVEPTEPPAGPPEQRTAPFAHPSPGRHQPPVAPDVPPALPRRAPTPANLTATSLTATTDLSAPRGHAASPAAPAAPATRPPAPTTGDAPTVQFPVIRDSSGRGPAAGPASVTWQTPTGSLAPAAQPASTTAAPAAPPKAPAPSRQTPSEPPPVSVRGLPMFLAALLGLGTIGIVFMTMPGSGKADSAPKPNATASAGPAAPAAATGTPSGQPSHHATGATPSSRPILGSLDQQTMGKFCASRDAGFATLRREPQGAGAAIDNWACTGKSRTRGFTIVPTDVCQWRYGSSAVAGYLNRNDAYSWRCYH